MSQLRGGSRKSVFLALTVLATLIGMGCSSSAKSSSVSTTTTASANAYQPVMGAKASGCPSGTGPGVTSKQITVAVGITNIQGPVTNKALGIPSPEEQQAGYQAVFNSLDAAGGAGCRQLVAQYFQINPADASDLQSKCLNISQASVFALIDGGGAGGMGGQGALCYARAHVPFIGGLNLPTAEAVTSSYPYVFDISATTDAIDYAAVIGLKGQGFFDPANGFKRLGLMVSTCDPQSPAEMAKWLSQAGVPSSQIDTFNFGCPAYGLFPASGYQQAVLKFQQAGDTNVTAGGMAGWPLVVTKYAAQQNYKPKWGLPDEDVDSILTQGNAADSPNNANLAGGLLVTTGRYGEENASPLNPDAATAKCNAIVTAAGLPTTYQQSLGGQACDQVWMLAAAIDNSTTISRQNLAAGLQASKSVDFSFPMGMNDFTGQHVTTGGGQFYRVDEFMSSCNCFKLLDPTFHPTPASI